MATKEELAQSLTKAELTDLLEEVGVNVSGDERKSELVEAVVTNRKISKEVIQSAVAEEEDETTEDEDETEEEEETTPTDAPATTSDASTRAEGQTAAETPADASSGPKSSDAGPEAYPFPTGGDVDVATVDAGDSDEEQVAPLAIGDAVTLGEHDDVPERLQGRIAYVTAAPQELADPDDAAEQEITVKTRDEVNATLVLPREALENPTRGVVPTVRG